MAVRSGTRIARTTRVWFHGHEVTACCYYADARRGVIRGWRTDRTGTKYNDGRGSLQKFEARGPVIIRRKAGPSMRESIAWLWDHGYSRAITEV